MLKVITALPVIALAAVYVAKTADAASVKPGARPPGIILRAPIRPPQPDRLRKKNAPGAVANPTETRGGTNAEGSHSAEDRAPSRLRTRGPAMAPIPRSRPHGNVLAVLYFIFKEAVAEQNADKKYWLKKLHLLNAVAVTASQYMEDLTNKARELNEKVQNGDEDGKDGDCIKPDGKTSSLSGERC